MAGWTTGLAWATGMACLGLSALAQAQVGLGEHLPDCRLVDFVEREDATVYACADGRWGELAYVGGGVVLRASGRLPSGFAGFVALPGEVQVEVEDRRRVPLAELRASATVRAVNGRAVQLDRPLPVGARVRFADGDRPGPVGRVVASDDEGAVVDIGVGEVVRAGFTAEETALAASADPWAPPGHDNIWEVVLGARPFVGVDAPSGGLIGSFSLRYRTASPFVMSSEWAPIGVSAGPEGVGFNMAVYGLLGFDIGVVELSVGAGATSDATGHCCGDIVFSLVQRARLGARDGLFLEGTFVEGVRGRLVLQSLGVRAQLPLEPFGVRDLWLVARGGGGEAGYGMAELGVRFLAHGGGWKRSVFVTALAGAAALFDDRNFRASWQRTGPLLGVELEARF